MVQPRQLPLANFFIPCILHPLHLVSIIPPQLSSSVYHIWFRKSGTDRVRMGHILTAYEHIHLASCSGIDHEILSSHFKSDHCLTYASFALSCTDTLPSSPTTKQFHYRRVAHIPPINIYPRDSHETSLPWFEPKTLGISCLPKFMYIPRCTKR